MKLRMTLFSLLVFFNTFGLSAFGATTNPVLRIESMESSGKSKVRRISLSQMKNTLSQKDLVILNPEFQNTFHYKAFLLKDLLKPEIEKENFDELVFICSDGYRSPLDRARFDKLHLHLAFGEKLANGREGWTVVDHAKQKITPAPFYVLSSDPNEYKDYNWPFMVVAIELVSYKKRYAEILPKDLEKVPATASTRGFQLFRKECIRCHTVNLVGGDIGPELNTPRNVLEYLDHDYIKQFVRNPGAFRAKDKMPPFPNMTDENLSDIFAYLEEMGQRKLK